MAKDAQREREHRERDRQREARVKKNREGYVEVTSLLLDHDHIYSHKTLKTTFRRRVDYWH